MYMYSPMYGKIAMVGDILILLHMEYNTSNQNLLTCNPLYFQGCIPFKFIQFLVIFRRQGRKMVHMSRNVYTTSHPLRQTSLYVSRLLATGPNFGSSDFTGSLRGQSELNGMSSDPHKGVNSLDLILKICLD